MNATVIPINRKRVARARNTQKVSNSELRWLLAQKPEKASVLTEQGRQDIIESLEEAGDEWRTTILALAHEQEKAQRTLRARIADADAELEAAVYTAFMNGVPEDTIYDINDERLSDALQSAMNKVQQA